MKKSLAVLMLAAVCALTLTGCFQSPQAEPEQNQPETITEVKDEVVVPPAEELEGGGGVAADETGANYPEAPATIAEKLDDFEKYGTKYTGDIIYGCNTEADELNKNLKSGGILAVQVYKSSFHDVTIYKTTNPDKMTKGQLEQIADSCAELGTNQVLKATEDYVLWGYPVCAAGALPDPELQPELYKDYFDCVKATDAVAAYFK